MISAGLYPAKRQSIVKTNCCTCLLKIKVQEIKIRWGFLCETIYFHEFYNFLSKEV